MNEMKNLKDNYLEIKSENKKKEKEYLNLFKNCKEDKDFLSQNSVFIDV